MSVRSVDENGEWTFGAGLGNYKTEDAEIRQSIQTRLKSVLGDCFFDQTAGIDWQGLSDKGSQSNLALAIAAQILNTEGVTELVDFSFSTDNNREFFINIEIKTVFGNLDVNVVV